MDALNFGNQKVSVIQERSAPERSENSEVQMVRSFHSGLEIPMEDFIEAA
jgi:hypothetical protein